MEADVFVYLLICTYVRAKALYKQYMFNFFVGSIRVWRISNSYYLFISSREQLFCESSGNL